MLYIIGAIKCRLVKKDVTRFDSVIDYCFLWLNLHNQRLFHLHKCFYLDLTVIHFSTLIIFTLCVEQINTSKSISMLIFKYASEFSSFSFNLTLIFIKLFYYVANPFYIPQNIFYVSLLSCIILATLWHWTPHRIKKPWESDQFEIQIHLVHPCCKSNLIFFIQCIVFSNFLHAVICKSRFDSMIKFSHDFAEFLNFYPHL